MADQIAGMPKKYVLVGGAAAAGIIGYAWWKNGSGGSAEVVDPSTEPIEAAADDYESPLGNSGGNSTGSFPGNVDPDAIDTNAEWTAAAVDALEASGWERSAVLSALGKYLAFKGLTPAEVNIVMAARAIQGEPPVGGPFPIKDALPTPPTTTPPVTKPPVVVKPPVVKPPAKPPVKTPAKPAPKPVYYTVRVAKFTTKNPPWNSTISGIAAHYKKSTSYVWNDAKNASLRAKRKAMNKIQPGDTVYVKK